MVEVRTTSVPMREARTTSVSSVATIQAVRVQPSANEFTIYAPTNAYNLQVAPRIIFCGKTADGGTTFTDYTGAATDGSAATDVDLDSLNTAANSNYFYVACHYPFGGIDVDVDDSHPNTTASTLTGYYLNTSSVWTNLSITDGTSSTSACFAIDGNITWTVPSDWATQTLNGIKELFVVRFQVSAQLDSDTLIDGIGTLSGVAGHVLVAGTTYVYGIDTNSTGSLNIDESGATSQTIRVNWISNRQPTGI